VVCQIQFFAAPSGCKPRLRDQEQHRLTAVCRLIKRTLPALTGCDAALRIEIKENFIFPAVSSEPVSQRDCFWVVGAGMADENARHANRPKVKRRPTEA
jgi:hypothetical protein